MQHGCQPFFFSLPNQCFTLSLSMLLGEWERAYLYSDLAGVIFFITLYGSNGYIEMTMVIQH